MAKKEKKKRRPKKKVMAKQSRAIGSGTLSGFEEDMWWGQSEAYPLRAGDEH